MSNVEKYQNAFLEALNNIGSRKYLAEDLVNASTNTIQGWDSIFQMTLIAILEEAFEISIEPGDILALNSFQSGLVILNRYGLEL